MEFLFGLTEAEQGRRNDRYGDSSSCLLYHIHAKRNFVLVLRHWNFVLGLRAARYSSNFSACLFLSLSITEVKLMNVVESVWCCHKRNGLLCPCVVWGEARKVYNITTRRINCSMCAQRNVEHQNNESFTSLKYLSFHFQLLERTQANSLLRSFLIHPVTVVQVTQYSDFLQALLCKIIGVPAQMNMNMDDVFTCNNGSYNCNNSSGWLWWKQWMHITSVRPVNCIAELCLQMW